MENNQQEIIEVQDGNGQKTGLWQTAKDKLAGMSKKTIVLLSVGALVLVTGGFVAAEVFENRFEVIEDRIERQVGAVDYDDDDKYEVASSNATTTATASQTANELATAYGVKLVDTSDLDGTYTATSGNDIYTLTVTGNQATLVEADNDGDRDSDIIIFDLDQKLAYVDGEAETYTISGKTLTLTEVDSNDTTKDQLVFTKQ
ncbi:TPA: hypothetical protein U0K67_001784 [Streptococcus suis]|nr:hypothetical protein [Streptococcus suis]